MRNRESPRRAGGTERPYDDIQQTFRCKLTKNPILLFKVSNTLTFLIL